MKYLPFLLSLVSLVGSEPVRRLPRRKTGTPPEAGSVPIFLSPLASPALSAGGPDAGGYRWCDSDSAPGPAFQWLDITQTGARLLLGDDDNQGPFDLGSAFSFYDTSCRSVRICSNGWLSFTSSSHQFHQYHLPDRYDPNALIAPFWTDLDPSAGGGVYYLADSVNQRFIVSWVKVPRYNRSDSCSFQVVLDTSGRIFFQYLDVPEGARRDSCSVGLENPRGLVGLEYVFDGEPATNRLHDSLAIEFWRLQHDVSPAQFHRPWEQAFTGDTVIPLVRVRNSGLAPASFPVTLRISTGYEQQLSVTNLAPLHDTLMSFPAWVAPSDTARLEAFTALVGDEWPMNDTLRMFTLGADVGEIRYDDGLCDSWYFRNGAPNRDWGVAVRFTLPYPSVRLLEARLLVGDTQHFARIVLCPGDTLAPDVAHALVQVEAISAPGPGTWLVIPADTIVTASRDVWLVALLPRSATGPAIGMDMTLPLDLRSSFGSPGLGWFRIMAGDLIARLKVSGMTGVAEEGYSPGFRGPKAGAVPARCDLWPNPLTGGFLNLSGKTGTPPEAGSVPIFLRIDIYDASGRKVRSQSVTGHQARLDLRGLESGVYLVRCALNQASPLASVHKLVIR
jgi:hypothetical protein